MSEEQNELQPPVLPPGLAPAVRPPRHAVIACVALMLFWPTGIPAVIAAFGVDEALLWGDAGLARRRSRRALWLGWVSVVLACAGAIAAIAVTAWLVTGLMAAAPTVLTGPGMTHLDPGAGLPQHGLSGIPLELLLGGEIPPELLDGSVPLESLLDGSVPLETPQAPEPAAPSSQWS